MKGAAVKRIERRPAIVGRRYVLPQAIAAALEQVFDEPVGGIVVIEHSRYAREAREFAASAMNQFHVARRFSGAR